MGLAFPIAGTDRIEVGRGGAAWDGGTAVKGGERRGETAGLELGTVGGGGAGGEPVRGEVGGVLDVSAGE